MQVVIKIEPVLAHGRIKSLFSRVAEWRVTDVVHQSKGLDQINIQPELRGNSP